MSRSNEKKNKSVTVQLTQKEHAILQMYAEERDWSLSKTVGNLLRETIKELEAHYEQN